MRQHRHNLLEQGSSGEIVAVLQEALNQVGYDLEVDGIFGHGTHVAVRDFQNNNDLDVDGVVGPNTWDALSEALG